jgi:hypothetical protein
MSVHIRRSRTRLAALAGIAAFALAHPVPASAKAARRSRSP